MMILQKPLDDPYQRQKKVVYLSVGKNMLSNDLEKRNDHSSKSKRTSMNLRYVKIPSQLEVHREP